MDTKRRKNNYTNSSFSLQILGFGLLESGMVSRKNEVNIMVKNSVDVIFGGLSYWMFGYAFSFGTDEGSNWFCGEFFIVTLNSMQIVISRTYN